MPLEVTGPGAPRSNRRALSPEISVRLLQEIEGGEGQVPLHCSPSLGIGALRGSNKMSSGDLILALYGIGTILGGVYTCILVRERYRNARD
jgi:hypothetical protein